MRYLSSFAFVFAVAAAQAQHRELISPLSIADVFWGHYAQDYHLKGKVKTVEVIEAPDKLHRQQTFDSLGNLTEELFFASNRRPSNKVINTYNTHNQLTESKWFSLAVTETLSSVSTYQYNSQGVVISEKRVLYPNNETRTTTYQYDKNNRLLKITTRSGSRKGYSTFEYNANGLLRRFERFSNENGLMEMDTRNTYFYNAQNQLVEEKNENLEPPTETIIYKHSYNAQGLLSQTVNESLNYTITYLYSPQGWLLEKKTSFNDISTPPHTITFDLDEKGNCIKTTTQKEGSPDEVVIYNISYY